MDLSSLLVFAGGIAAGAVGVLVLRRRRTASVCMVSELASAARALAAGSDPAFSLPAALASAGQALGLARLELHEVHVPQGGETPLSTLRVAWAAPGVRPRADAPEQRDRPWHPARTAWLGELAAGRTVAVAAATINADWRAELDGHARLLAAPVMVEGRLSACLVALGGDAPDGVDREPALRLLAELVAAAQTASRAAQRIIRLREAAESGEKTKREFIANISHELRTPLTGVLGMVGMLIDSGLDQRQREYAQVVRGSAETLNALLNDLIALARSEGGQRAEAIRFDPLRLAEEVTTLLADRAMGKGVGIAVEPTDDLPRLVVGDAARLRQILVNLLGNAVKFTARGHIITAVGWEEGCLVFAVRDTGIGIDTQAQRGLFRDFSQADASTTRRFGGTGLGLAVCRRMVDAMGGDIACVSEPGRGSVFTVRIPVEEVTGGRSGSGSVDASLVGAPVLVVDPDPATRAALAAVCRRQGFSVADAADADEAVTRTGGHGAPRVVIVASSTIGYEALPARIAASGGDAVCLLLCPPSARLAREECIRLGYADCLARPPRGTRLADAVGRALSEIDDESSQDGTGMIQRQRQRLRALVVENDAVNQMIAKTVLEREGLRVDAVSDGDEALERFAHGGIDLVIMDLLMPVMDGFTCATAIRRIEREAGRVAVPIVAVSALDDPGLLERCRAAGIDSLLRKPFEPRQLRRILRTHCEADGARRPRA